MWRCTNKTISLETNQYRKLAVYPYSSQHLSNVCISALTYWHHHQVMMWSNEEHASVRLLFKQRIDKIFTFQISADWDKEYNTCSVGPWCLVQQCAVSAGEASTHPLTCQGRGQVDGWQCHQHSALLSRCSHSSLHSPQCYVSIHTSSYSCVEIVLRPAFSLSCSDNLATGEWSWVDTERKSRTFCSLSYFLANIHLTLVLKYKDCKYLLSRRMMIRKMNHDVH